MKTRPRDDKGGGERIALLVANFNHARYLPVCLDSVLAQTSDRWDVILVDDCSSDHSEEVYRDYGARPRIHVHRNEQNLGYIGTLKRLIDLSPHDIVGILDPDDALRPTCVERVLAVYAKRPRAGFVYTNFWYCDEHLNPVELGYCRRLARGETCLEANCVSALRTFRRSVYRRTAGLDESLRYAEDKDLALKMEEVTRLHFVDEPLYLYRVLPESQSHGPKRQIGLESFARARELAAARRKRQIFGRLRREAWSCALRRRLRRRGGRGGCPR